MSDEGKPVTSWNLSGVSDISGSFSGTLFDFEGYEGNDPIDVFIYGPNPYLPWWKHWFYRIRERVTGTPYPVIVLAHGPATFNVDAETGGVDVVRGTFTSDGTWEIKT